MIQGATLGEAMREGTAGGPDYVWPSGKHQGERLGDIDTSYLNWVLEKADKMPEPMKQRVRDELARRSA